MAAASNDLLDLLPRELWQVIRGYLADDYDARDLVSFQRTCRAARALQGEHEGRILAPVWARLEKDLEILLVKSIWARSSQLHHFLNPRQLVTRILQDCYRARVFDEFWFRRLSVLANVETVSLHMSKHKCYYFSLTFFYARPHEKDCIWEMKVTVSFNPRITCGVWKETLEDLLRTLTDSPIWTRAIKLFVDCDK